MSSRIDIAGGVTSGSWAGKGCFPFGLISCPGWHKPLTRLSNKLASLNRQFSRSGCRYKIINIRPSKEGLIFDASVKIEGRQTRESSAALSSAIRAAKRSCARICRVCGAPAVHINGESLCPADAPDQLRIETYFDKRKIRRSGILLARRFGARITHVVKFQAPGNIWLNAYSIDGIMMARLIEARPGSRMQILDSSSSIIHQLELDEFMIELPIKLWTNERL